jgi:hypothetical protein
MFSIRVSNVINFIQHNRDIVDLMFIRRFVVENACVLINGIFGLEDFKKYEYKEGIVRVACHLKYYRSK